MNIFLSKILMIFILASSLGAGFLYCAEGLFDGDKQEKRQKREMYGHRGQGHE